MILSSFPINSRESSFHTSVVFFPLPFRITAEVRELDIKALGATLQSFQTRNNGEKELFQRVEFLFVPCSISAIHFASECRDVRVAARKHRQGVPGCLRRVRFAIAVIEADSEGESVVEGSQRLFCVNYCPASFPCSSIPVFSPACTPFLICRCRRR